MLAEMRAGPPGNLGNSEGTVATGRISRIAALITADAQGRYYEQASRGNIFSLSLLATSASATAGQLNGAAAAAATQFMIWNPLGSGKNLSLLKFGLGVVSSGNLTATTGIQVFHSWCIAPTNATTVATPIQCNNTALAPQCAARAWTSAAGAAVAGNSILQFIRQADLSFTSSGAAPVVNLMGMKAIEYIDGDIVIPPGVAWVPTFNAGAGSSTTLYFGYSITWEEIPI